MALTVDKDGKVVDKHLAIDEATIKEVVSKTNKLEHKKVFQRASKVKINRRIAS